MTVGVSNSARSACSVSMPSILGMSMSRVTTSGLSSRDLFKREKRRPWRSRPLRSQGPAQDLRDHLSHERRIIDHQHPDTSCLALQLLSSPSSIPLLTHDRAASRISTTFPSPRIDAPATSSERDSIALKRLDDQVLLRRRSGPPAGPSSAAEVQDEGELPARRRPGTQEQSRQANKGNDPVAEQQCVPAVHGRSSLVMTLAISSNDGEREGEKLLADLEQQRLDHGQGQRQPQAG